MSGSGASGSAVPSARAYWTACPRRKSADTYVGGLSRGCLSNLLLVSTRENPLVSGFQNGVELVLSLTFRK